MVVCLALMVVMVFGNVVLRYGFNSGITVSEELSRWLFVWMTFLGALVALRNHAHLGTDTAGLAPAGGGQEDLPRARHLLMLYLCWLMPRAPGSRRSSTAGTTSAVMEASMGYFYASGVFFAVFAALFIAQRLLEAGHRPAGRVAS
jgi:TRAP-type C4-dicarboxylate transport system permease small subunit